MDQTEINICVNYSLLKIGNNGPNRYKHTNCESQGKDEGKSSVGIEKNSPDELWKFNCSRNKFQHKRAMHSQARCRWKRQSFVLCFVFSPHACLMGDLRLVLTLQTLPGASTSGARRRHCCALCMNEAFSVDMGHASRCTQQDYLTLNSCHLI